MSAPILALNENNLTRINAAIRALAQGRSNATGQFALAVAPATSTVVSAANMGAGSVPIIVPIDADAATEWASGNAYVSDRAPGSFTITHSSSADTRSFLYAILG